MDWNEIFRIHVTESSVLSVVTQKLHVVIQNHSDLFKDELGTIKGLSAKLELKEGVSPKFFRARTVPYALQQAVEDEYNRLERDGIIRKVEFSDWATPMVHVPKFDGSTRSCGNYAITVNPHLNVPSYPIPLPEDVFHKLRGGQKYTKLDLKNAYQQLTLDEESQKFVTINTHRGLYRYTHLPFGIASSPAVFQRTMDVILQGLDQVACIQDDILLTGKDDAEHLSNLARVLTRLQEYGLRLKLSKCKFMQRTVTYMGYKLSADGISPTEEKVEAIKSAPTPENATQVRAFLGLLNYHGKFIPNLSTIVHPLNQLLQKDKEFQWTAACDQAFRLAKESLTSSKVLVHFNPDLPIVLECDASQYILNEVLKVGKDFIKGHLITLFNRILSTGKYPLIWSFGLIVPVHKKDDPSKVENYRGITLLSSLSKLFTTILNNRLYDYATKKGILKDEQGGFRKMHGTVDSLFILKMLIDKYVKSKPQRQRNLLFSCFVDFSKAFDTVPRKKLFDKFRTVGINGHFLEVLMSMYSNDKSAVKIENKITETFPCHIGVKQGCMLSPTLFNIYLSDLPEMLNIASTTEVMLRERPTNCLLYADDLVIFARSAEGLQRILNKLESFCEKVDLTVNLDKTKVMIFNNSGKSLNNYSFKYGTNKLENTKSYRYLGLTLCPYGNFTLARQELKKASLKALFKLRNEMGNHFSENIKLTFKLFDALISPILMYGSEIWGIDCNGKLDTDPEELVQNKFLKWLLGVNKYCNNNACRAETGRFPLRMTAQCRTLKFWLTLVKHEENNCHKLSQVAYNDIKWIKDKISWSQKIKNFLYHIGLGILWEKAHPPDVGAVSIVRQRLEDIELQRWFSEMNNDTRKDPNQSNKMRTYRKVKKIDNYRCEDYLHQVTNIRHRTTMTKLRLSNHRLAIETGRYMRPYKKPNERICPLCKKEAEDEKHFLVSCPGYQEKRKSLFEHLSTEFKIPIGKMSTENIFFASIKPPK